MGVCELGVVDADEHDHLVGGAVGIGILEEITVVGVELESVELGRGRTRATTRATAAAPRVPATSMRPSPAGR